MPRAEIDKRYLDKPYYIAPNGKTGAEAFVVIRDAMQDEGRVALARIVMAHREHIIMLEPLGKGLLGTTLRYDYEVRSERSTSRIYHRRASAGIWFLWRRIFLRAKQRGWIAEKFKDEYEKALRKLVQRKAKGHAIEAPEPEERPSNVINLMEALRESVRAGCQAGRPLPDTKAQSAATQIGVVIAVRECDHGERCLGGLEAVGSYGPF